MEADMETWFSNPTGFWHFLCIEICSAALYPKEKEDCISLQVFHLYYTENS